MAIVQDVAIVDYDFSRTNSTYISNPGRSESTRLNHSSTFKLNGDNFYPATLQESVDEDNIKQARKNGAVTPQMFGAVGNGTTDDTAALMAMFASTHEKIYFPDGTYVSDMTFINTKKQITLSRKAIIKLKPGRPLSTLFQVNAAAKGTTFSGGTLDGNRKHQKIAYGKLILVYATDCVIDKMTLINSISYGIEAIDASRLVVSNCTFRNNGYISLISHCETTSNEGGSILNNTVDNSLAAKGANVAGIMVRGNRDNTIKAKGWKIQDNTVIQPMGATFVEAECIEFRGEDSDISSNVTIGGSLAISVVHSKNVTVANNSIKSPSVYGGELAGSSLCIFTGNTVDAGKQPCEGLSVSTHAYDNIVVGNTFTNCTYGINQNIDAQGLTISNNTFLKNIVGLHLASKNVTCSGNYFDGQDVGKKGILLDNNEGSMTFTGNTFKSMTESSVMIYSASAVVIDKLVFTGNNFILTTNPPIEAVLSGRAKLGANIQTKGNTRQPDYSNLRDRKPF